MRERWGHGGRRGGTQPLHAGDRVPEKKRRAGVPTEGRGQAWVPRARQGFRAAPGAGVGKVGCPRRGPLLCSLPSMLAPGDPTGGKTPASRRQSHSQGRGVPAHLSNPPSPFWIQPFTSAFTFDLSGVIPRTGATALVTGSHGGEGRHVVGPCSPLPTCTTLQPSVSEDRRRSWGRHHGPLVPPGGDKEERQEQVTLMRSGKNLQSTCKAAVASSSGSPSLFSQ